MRLYIDSVIAPVASELARSRPAVELFGDLLAGESLDLLLVAAMEPSSDDPEVAAEVARGIDLLADSCADPGPGGKLNGPVMVAGMFGGRMARQAHLQLLTAQELTR